MSTITAHGAAPATLASRASLALGWVVAAAWRARWVPQDGEHPAWCGRWSKGCRGRHDMAWRTGYGNGSTWHLGGTLAIGADEDQSPRIVGALAQRDSDWCFTGKADGERASTGALMARLELSVEDARLFAHDLLEVVHGIEAGIPSEGGEFQ